MIPLSLTIKNIYSHENTYINFRRKRLSLIVGEVDGIAGRSNTAGKSSIYSAYEYALFGTTRAGSDRVVRDGEKKGEVSLVFRAGDGNVYKVVRSTTLGKNETTTTTLDFYFSDKTQWIRKDSEVLKDRRALQAEIDKVIGMKAELFPHSVRIQQQDIGLLAKTDPSTVKELLKEFIDLKRYDKLESISKERRDQTSLELDTSKKIIEDLSARVENIDLINVNISSVEKSILEATESKADKTEIVSRLAARLQKAQELDLLKKGVISISQSIKTTQETMSHINSTKESLKNDWFRDRDELEKRLAGKESLLKRQQSIFEEVSSLPDRLSLPVEAARKEFNELSEKVAIYGAKIKDIRDRKKNLQSLSGKCPTCSSQVDEMHRGKILGELHHEFDSCQNQLHIYTELLEKQKSLVEDYVRKEKEFSEKTMAIAKLKAESEGIKQTLDKLQSDETALTEKKKNVAAKCKEMKSSVDKMQETLTRLGTEKKVALEEYNKALADLKDIDSVKTQHDKLLIELKAIENSILSSQKSLGELQQRLQSSLKLAKEVEKRRVDIDALTKKLNIQINVWKALGKQGVQALVLENSMAHFESSTRMYLKRFNGYDIKFDTTIANKKTGNAKETFRIMIDKGNGQWHPYVSCSGSESTYVDFAIRLGLINLSASYNSVRQDYLFIDEIAGAMDPFGRKAFMEILAELAKDFGLILVITHFSELQEEFNDIITVRKSGYISSVIDSEAPEEEDLLPIRKEQSKKITRPNQKVEITNSFYVAEET